MMEKIKDESWIVVNLIKMMKLNMEDSGNWPIMIKLGTWNDKSNDMDENLLFQWNWQHDKKERWIWW